MVLASVSVLTSVPLETSLSRDDFILHDLSLAEALDTEATTSGVLFVAGGTRHHLCGETTLLVRDKFADHICITNLILL